MKEGNGDLPSSLTGLLESRLGMDLSTLGPKSVERALQSRMTALQLTSRAEYAARLGRNEAEWQTLVDLLMVTETWFFRYPDAFVHLGRLAVCHRKQPEPRPVFRVLSAPCSTGEEACSIALCLISAGMEPEEFIVDAVDINRTALDRALTGTYALSVLNRAPSLVDSPYLHRRDHLLEMDAALMERIRYRHDDLLSEDFTPEGAPYPVIFCRNMMIYFRPDTRRRVGRMLARFLTPAGRLFVGHAESDLFREAGLVPDHGMSGAFALKKAEDAGAVRRGFFIRSPRPFSADGRAALPGSGMTPYGLSDDSTMDSTFEPVFEPSSIHAPDYQPPDMSSDMLPDPLSDPLSDSLSGPLSGESSEVSSREVSSENISDPSTDPSAVPFRDMAWDRKTPVKTRGKQGAGKSGSSGKTIPPSTPGPPDVGRLTNTEAAEEMAIARRLADEGALTSALERLTYLVETRPAWADAWYLMGLIHESRKDKRQAESCFSRTVYLNPEHLEGLRHLAAMAAERGDRIRAEALGRRARRAQERNKDGS